VDNPVDTSGPTASKKGKKWKVVGDMSTGKAGVGTPKTVSRTPVGQKKDSSVKICREGLSSGVRRSGRIAGKLAPSVKLIDYSESGLYESTRGEDDRDVDI